FLLQSSPTRRSSDLRVSRRYDLLFDDRQPDPVCKLVDQDEVAYLERRPHRRTGYLERLGDERAQEKDDEQNRKKTLRILDPPWLDRKSTRLNSSHQI